MQCPDCKKKMSVRTNGYTGERFWGCNGYPYCKGTRSIDRINILPVFKRTEDSMSDTFPNFISGKWYILSKPTGEAGLPGTTQMHKLGAINWIKDMNQYDGKIVQCEAVDGTLANFTEGGPWAYHSAWAEGPFDTKEEALRSQIRLQAIREPEEEKITFANGEVRLTTDDGIDHNMEVISVQRNGNIIEARLRDPVTGIVSVETREEEPVKKSEILEKVRARWETPKGHTLKVDDRGYDIGMATAADPQSGCLELSANEVRINGTDFDDLLKRVEALEQPEKEVVEQVQSLEDKHQEEIDRIFRDYHERNRRKQELNERIALELGKNETKPWHKPALAISTVAIGWSIFTLFPYMGGIKHFLGF